MTTPKRTSFQFSIRELLLAITACGLVLSLVLQNVHHWVPLAGTELTRDFSLQTVVIQIASSQGVTDRVSGSGGGGAGSGPRSRRVSSSYGFRIPPNNRAAIFKSLQEKIGDILAESGCKVMSGGSGSQSSYSAYENSSLFGVVKVEMHEDSVDPEYVHVNYLAVEFKK